MIGVSMISGTFVLTDKMNAAFSGIFKAGNQHVDVAIWKKSAFGSDPSTGVGVPFDVSFLPRVQGVAGVREAVAMISTSGFLVKGDKKLSATGGAPCDSNASWNFWSTNLSPRRFLASLRSTRASTESLATSWSQAFERSSRATQEQLARTIEQNRASRRLISRGFTLLNQMARASQRHPSIRQMLVSGPLEYIVDAPKARALARKRLSPAAQGYLESLCE